MVWVQTCVLLAAFGVACLGRHLPPAAAAPAERTIRIVAFGDSLTAGFNLPASAAFPAKLQEALRSLLHDQRSRQDDLQHAALVGQGGHLQVNPQDGPGAVLLEGGAEPAQEPWTSNSQSSDVAKRHVEVSVRGEQKYTVVHGGNMDGTNCRTPIGCGICLLAPVDRCGTSCC